MGLENLRLPRTPEGRTPYVLLYAAVIALVVWVARSLWRFLVGL